MIADDVVKRMAEATVANFDPMYRVTTPETLTNLLVEFHRNVEATRERDPEERVAELLRSNNELRDRAMTAERKLKEMLGDQRKSVSGGLNILLCGTIHTNER